jgi:hypothetical protein
MTTENSVRSPRILKVCQDRDYDCVYLNGRKINLGRTGTPEADAAFRKLQIQVLTDPTLSSFSPQQQVTVDDYYVLRTSSTPKRRTYYKVNKMAFKKFPRVHEMV